MGWKGGTPSKDSLQETRTRMGFSCPSEHLQGYRWRLPLCLYGYQNNSALYSRIHNHFVIFPILNIELLTLSYILYICMCVCIQDIYIVF